MKKLISHFAIATAASSMALAPIAVQANTRAGDSPVIYSARGLAQTTTDPWIKPDDDEAGAWLDSQAILGIILGALAIGGLLAVLGDNDDQSPGPPNRSPGAN